MPLPDGDTAHGRDWTRTNIFVLKTKYPAAALPYEFVIGKRRKSVSAGDSKKERKSFRLKYPTHALSPVLSAGSLTRAAIMV